MSRVWDDQFLGEELTASENTRDTARFEVVPCGLEATVSYGTGAAQGPSAIIAASHQLERLVYDTEPCREGIFTHPPVNCDRPVEEVMQGLRDLTADIARRGHVPVTLGGEHSISYGAVTGVVDALGPIGLIHVDAHADFRDAYQGHKFSHASVMYLLAGEGLPMVSLGVRALSVEEDAARKAHGVITHDARQLMRDDTHEITLPEDFPENVYITFDLDGLDPSVVPSTGTPVPGGLGFYQALDLVESAAHGRNVKGIDVVELAPVSGQPVSDFTAALISYHLMRIALDT